MYFKRVYFYNFAFACVQVAYRVKPYRIDSIVRIRNEFSMYLYLASYYYYCSHSRQLQVDRVVKKCFSNDTF